MSETTRQKISFYTASKQFKAIIPRSLPDGQKWLLGTLFDYAHEDGGGIFASRESIENLAGFTRPTFYRHLKALTDAGFVTRGECHDTSGALLPALKIEFDALKAARTAEDEAEGNRSQSWDAFANIPATRGRPKESHFERKRVSFREKKSLNSEIAHNKEEPALEPPLEPAFPLTSPVASKASSPALDAVKQGAAAKIDGAAMGDTPEAASALEAAEPARSFRQPRKDLPPSGASLGLATVRQGKALREEVAAPSEAEIAQGFARFWQAFPAKSGKAQAERNFRLAVEGRLPLKNERPSTARHVPVPIADLIRGAEGYAEDVRRQPADRSVKYAQGWLTERRWRDYEDGKVDIRGAAPIGRPSPRAWMANAAKRAPVVASSLFEESAP